MSLTRYKAVADMAAAISSSTEYEDVLATVAEQAVTAFEVCECCLYEYDPGAAEAMPVALWGVDSTPEDQAYVGVPVTFVDTPAMRSCLVDGEVAETRINDSLLQSHDRQQMDAWDEKSVLWVPLVFGGEIIGCMEIIEKRYVRPFTDYDLEFAATISALAAVAIHTARMRHLLQMQEHKLEVLLGASRDLAGAVNEQEVLDSIASTTGRALTGDACFIYLYEPEFETVSWVATWFRDPSIGAALPDEQGTTYRLSDFAADQRALKDGVIVQRRVSDPDLSAAERRELEEWGFRTVLTVPAIVDGVPVGQLEVTHAEAEYLFSDDELDLARALADQAAVVLQRRAHRGASAGGDERPVLD